MSQSDLVADQRAAQAVVRHHEQLAAVLSGHVGRLVEAADAGTARQVWSSRDELSAWVHGELLPHAYAEEASLYPAAAGLPAGPALVKGMLGEHRLIAGLVAELEESPSPVRVAAAARALLAVFTTHLAKENDLVVPMLVAAEEVSLAGLLDGLHDLIGAQPGAAGGCEGHPVEGTGRGCAGEADHGAAGCGCGGHEGGPGGGGHGADGCGCGGHEGGHDGDGHGDAGGGHDGERVDIGHGGSSAGGGCGCGAGGCQAAEASVLAIDARIDVRELPPAERHARVLAALAVLPAGSGLVLVAPHAPKPLLAEIESRFGGQVAREWLQHGPDVWQIRLQRLTTPA